MPSVRVRIFTYLLHLEKWKRNSNNKNKKQQEHQIS